MRLAGMGGGRGNIYEDRGVISCGYLEEPGGDGAISPYCVVEKRDGAEARAW